MSKRVNPYIIGFFKKEGWLPTWIIYYPLQNEISKEILICVFHGTNRSRSQGPCLAPSRMLEWTPRTYRSEDKNGVTQEVHVGYELPGWFERQCIAAGCSWFHSLVKRMAAGQEITIADIKNAYRENNGGRELEQKPIHELD